MVGAVSCFVAETPDDDRRMITVALHHSRATFDECRRIQRIITDTRVERMAFDVGLINHVHSEFVTKIIKRRIVRVMRTTNCRDVVSPHHF